MSKNYRELKSYDIWKCHFGCGKIFEYKKGSKPKKVKRHHDSSVDNETTAECPNCKGMLFYSDTIKR